MQRAIGVVSELRFGNDLVFKITLSSVRAE